MEKRNIEKYYYSDQMFADHKELIKRIAMDALAEKRRAEIARGQHSEEKIPAELMTDAGVYIRVLKDDKCAEEAGSVFAVMPFVKSLRAALEHITYADAAFEINVIKEIHPLLAKDQIKHEDGMFLQYGPYNAVLLPQELAFSFEEKVTVSKRSNRLDSDIIDDRLGMLCKKAKVHEDAWKEKGAQVFIFEAETFSII